MKRKVSKPTPATPQQVAAFGHIAAALRSFMKTRMLNVRQMNEKLGLTPTNTGLYNYVNCKGAPGHATRVKLAKLTGIPESDLLPRGVAPSRAVATVPVTVPVTVLATPARIKTQDVLGFTVDSDGMATITLHARLELDKATPLLRMILDAGVVFTKGE